MIEKKAYDILRRLSESSDKTMLMRKINCYKINYREQPKILSYLQWVERITQLRR